MHYYKFNIADWQASTRHLTPEEEGVYFRLINHYYDTESPIPLETQSVIRRLCLGSHSVLVAQILDEFFVKTDRGYEKEKCNEVIKDYKKTQRKNKANGAKGGRPRAGTGSEGTQTKPSGLSVGSQDKPKHNPNYKPGTINQELETSNQDKDITQPAPQDEDARFARWMLETILKDQPNFKQPTSLAKWTDTIRLMRERDNRNHRDMGVIWMWARNDDFWRGNILSATKFRAQYDQLHAQSVRPNGLAVKQQKEEEREQEISDWINGSDEKIINGEVISNEPF